MPDLEILTIEETQTPNKDSKVLINDNGAFKQAEVDNLLNQSDSISNIKASLSNQIDMGYLGKNLFNNKAIDVKNNNGTIRKGFDVEIPKDGTYYFKCDSISIAALYYGLSTNGANPTNLGSLTTSNKTFSVSATKGQHLIFWAPDATDAKDSLTNAMLSDDANAPYTPYAPSNFEITKIKEDLKDYLPNSLVSIKDFVQGSLDSTGKETSAGNRIRSIAIAVKPNTTYEVNAKAIDSTVVLNASASFYTTLGGTRTNSPAWNTLPYKFTTAMDTKYVIIIIRKSNDAGITPSEIEKVLVEEGGHIPSNSEIKDTLLSMSEIKRQIMQANATTLFDIPDDWKVALIIASKQAGNANYLSYKMALYSIVSDNYATLSTISQHNDRSEDVYNITELSINDNNKKQLKCSNGSYGGTLVISAIRIL